MFFAAPAVMVQSSQNSASILLYVLSIHGMCTSLYCLRCIDPHREAAALVNEQRDDNLDSKQ